MVRVAIAAFLVCLGLEAPARAAEATRLAGEVDAKSLPALIARSSGKVVLVNFWASWCGPCREEFPDLVRLEKAYRDKGLVVLGISTDFSKALPAVEKFLARAQPDFPNYRKSNGDEQAFIESIDPKWGGELPFSVLFARDGKKVATLSGKHSYAEYESAVGKLLQ